MVLYDCVGCVKKGNERIAYMIHDKSSNKTLKVNKFTMAVLVGRNQVSNAKGDIYKDIVIYRGVGCDFSKLPALKLNEDGTKKTKEQLVAEATERKAKRVQKVEEIAKNKAGRPSNEQLKAKYIESGQVLISARYMKRWGEIVENNHKSSSNRVVLDTALGCMQEIKNGLSYNEVVNNTKRLAYDGKITINECNNALKVVSLILSDKDKIFERASIC